MVTTTHPDGRLECGDHTMIPLNGTQGDARLYSVQGPDYAQYGLPLFKAVAVKYGFENPIGEDNGDESRYACEG